MDKSFFDTVEKAFKEAAKEAIAETHAAGYPTTHGDDKGVYRLYPNGEKKYIKLYEEEKSWTRNLYL